MKKAKMSWFRYMELYYITINKNINKTKTLKSGLWYWSVNCWYDEMPTLRDWSNFPARASNNVVFPQPGGPRRRVSLHQTSASWVKAFYSLYINAQISDSSSKMLGFLFKELRLVTNWIYLDLLYAKFCCLSDIMVIKQQSILSILKETMIILKIFTT